MRNWASKEVSWRTNGSACAGLVTRVGVPATVRRDAPADPARKGTGGDGEGDGDDDDVMVPTVMEPRHARLDPGVGHQPQPGGGALSTELAGQTQPDQLADATTAGESADPGQQRRPDPLSLPAILDQQRHLGGAGLLHTGDQLGEPDDRRCGAGKQRVTTRWMQQTVRPTVGQSAHPRVVAGEQRRGSAAFVHVDQRNCISHRSDPHDDAGVEGSRHWTIRETSPRGQKIGQCLGPGQLTVGERRPRTLGDHSLVGAEGDRGQVSAGPPLDRPHLLGTRAGNREVAVLSRAHPIGVEHPTQRLRGRGGPGQGIRGRAEHGRLRVDKVVDRCRADPDTATTLGFDECGQLPFGQGRRRAEHQFVNDLAGVLISS